MSFLERLLTDPVRVKRLKRGFHFSLGLIVLAEILLPLLFGGGHHHFGFEGLPGWGSLYGLLSCAVIIIVSKLIGKLWLMKREDYYDH